MAEGRRLARRLARLRRGAQNALELLSEGRLGAPYRAPYEIVELGDTYELRRYTAPEARRPERFPSAILLVPPLMVTAEVYDISPELSATALLAREGVDVWLCDFGTPEEVAGGLDRTLDDHIVAIDRCVDRIVAETNQRVHLIGYSQGGIFCYLAAAFRSDDAIRSLVTFGSPVDMRRNLPVPVDDLLSARVLDLARGILDGPLSRLEGLPGTFSSRGFKLMAPRQQLKHLIETLGVLSDREALLSSEPKRRFLGGDGFIAWPGPAFRAFVDDFVVGNRLKDGGFIIAGRSASLAEIEAPIAYFVGLKDDLARPRSVSAIERVAVNTRCHRFEVSSGHFGLVIGSQAKAVSWPSVLQWLAWIDGTGPRPERLATGTSAPAFPDDPAPSGVQGRGPRRGLAAELLGESWRRLGEVGLELSGFFSALRWQVPRLVRLAGLRPYSRVSCARLLAEQAEARGDAIFLLWRGRAFTYAEADARVTSLARVLYERGARRGQRVALLMGHHPDAFTLIAALNRLGAVSVVLGSESVGDALRAALEKSEADLLVADAEHLAPALEVFGGATWLLGPARGARPEGVLHLDPLIIRAQPGLPAGLAADPARGGELAALLFTSGAAGPPKAARITNGRWLAAGLLAATTFELTPRDTLYLTLPHDHPLGLLVGFGGALVGGARLALAERFDAAAFDAEVRRAGATVVLYAGASLAGLLDQPARPGDARLPLRLFAGAGLPPEIWRGLLERFDKARVIELYGSTAGPVVLVNRGEGIGAGGKIGSVGRELTGQVDLAVVRLDEEGLAPARDGDGRCVRCPRGEPGLLIGRLGGPHPLTDFAGFTDAEATEAATLRDVFEAGDRWFDSGDLFRVDADGDYFYLGRVVHRPQEGGA